jgi:beta-glucosidase
LLKGTTVTSTLPGDTVEADIEKLVAALTVAEKASLTAGASLWYVPAVERLGIPALKVSDGPSGVRGDGLIGRRSLSMSCGMGIGSTWNPELMGRLGEALAGEARSKGVHVLLGPTVCIVRTPVAGRTFESYSEDPFLTGRLAVAYVEGAQRHGVACCIKHFACNDQEHERMTISAEVDDRTLHEIHLPAFEAAVKEAGVWSIMTAYNKVNGTFASEQPHLIGNVLRDQWGFDGLVMSDWFGTHSTVPAALAGLDLEMPGPASHLGARLVSAVEDGSVPVALLDDKVRHLLRLMARVGILGGDPAAGRPEGEEDDPGRRAVARQVVTEGTVLLHNDGLLPLVESSSGPLQRVAVIGPNAEQLQGGGGSSEVTPHRRRRLVDALAERLPGVAFTHEVGCRIETGPSSLDMRLVSAHRSGPDGGWLVEYFDNKELAGTPVASEEAHSARVLWVGGLWGMLAAVDGSVRVSGTFTPDISGLWTLGLESAGVSVLRLNGDVVVDNTSPEPGSTFFGAGSKLTTGEVNLEAGRQYDLAAELKPNNSFPVLGLRVAADRPAVANEFERAIDSAAQADVAVVVVGLNGSYESEGFDRPDLSLPGRQRELIEAVIAANPRTVVVVNAGSPVDMPWAEQTSAVLLAWYPGEEGADGLADILVGAADPSGRLPVTIPKRMEDAPAFPHYPGSEGKVTYGEGVFVGYRHYDANKIEPHFPFGHGLSYTSFEYGEIRAQVVGAGTSLSVTLSVEVTNAGARSGSEVVQVYVRPMQAAVSRPDKELAAFAKVELAPGTAQTVTLVLDDRSFSYWDSASQSFVLDPGHYELVVGSSSRHIRGTVLVEVQ